MKIIAFSMKIIAKTVANFSHTKFNADNLQMNTIMLVVVYGYILYSQ